MHKAEEKKKNDSLNNSFFFKLRFIDRESKETYLHLKTFVIIFFKLLYSAMRNFRKKQKTNIF